MKSVVALAPEMAKVDFNPIVKFDCPVVFFVGDHDATTPGALVEAWFASDLRSAVAFAARICPGA